MTEREPVRMPVGFAARGRLSRFRVCLIAVALAGAQVSAAGGEEAGGPLLVPDRIKSDLMVILAHPDDEGGVAPLLARYALEGKKRVIGLYLTSGEAGSNRVGAIRGPAFGYLRLTELHWTLDRLGVAMFFSLNRRDLVGHDPDEVIRAWDRERTLRELTRYIRLVRPDQVITWFPGPASSHVAHAATGGVALLACRAAASGEAYPEQMETEGLRPHRVGEVLLVAQAEKVGYERYPGSRDRMLESGTMVREMTVDEHSPALGHRYTDIAREAMKEQRSVGAGSGLARGGAFDEPLILIRAFGVAAEGISAPAVNDPARGVRIALEGCASQRFLEEISRAVEAPGLAEIFWPQARVASEGATEVVIRAVNDRPESLKARAQIEAPPGWRVRPARVPISLDAGEAARLAFSVRPPGDGGSLYAVADVRIADEESGDLLLSEKVVLRRSAPEIAPPVR